VKYFCKNLEFADFFKFKNKNKNKNIRVFLFSVCGIYFWRIEVCRFFKAKEVCIIFKKKN